MMIQLMALTIFALLGALIVQYLMQKQEKLLLQISNQLESKQEKLLLEMKQFILGREAASKQETVTREAAMKEFIQKQISFAVVELSKFCS
jgi:hypothetical protein